MGEERNPGRVTGNDNGTGHKGVEASTAHPDVTEVPEGNLGTANPDGPGTSTAEETRPRDGR